MLKNKTLYNKEHNVEFWHIPKNAMTSIIADLSFFWVPNTQLPKDRKIFCVIRNPLDRILSSYLMCRDVLYGPYMSVYNIRNIDPTSDMFNLDKDILKGYQDYIDEIINNGPFDTHNIKQVHYIKDYVEPTQPNTIRLFDKITDFILMDNLNKELSKLFNKEIVLNKHNEANPLHIGLKKSLKEITEKNRDRILNYYNEDYAIYSKLKHKI
jgi:hypothetical protein